jgi:GH25 family lysozyme M1 (1,4-beta-N-acetylmuramidase)
MLRVIDTSSHKEGIDLSVLDIDGIYTRATYANYEVDSACDNIVEQAKAKNIPWGVYHFACNHLSGALEQADFFVDNCLGYIGKGLLILDWERENNDTSDIAWALTWLRRVYDRTGVKPLIYMPESIVNENDWSPVIAEDYGLIVANTYDGQPTHNFEYTTDGPSPTWGNAGNIMWQFSFRGQIDGYNGDLDCNWFYGDRNTWNAYARANSNTPVVVTPTPESVVVLPTPVSVTTPAPVVIPEPIQTTEAPEPIDVPVVTPVATPTPVIEPSVMAQSNLFMTFLYSLLSRKFIAAIILAYGLYQQKLYQEAVVTLIAYFTANVYESTKTPKA